jgi:hypothetical protein
MKKLLLLLSALVLSVALAGCSVEDIVEHIDLDRIADLVLELSKTELEAVKDADGIKEDLPQELAVVTVDDETLDCQVTHLAIRNRKTDNTRQTDWVECEVIVEGDGIYARYTCDLSYTYTRNSGWSLVDWSMDTENMTLQVTEGTLTQQFEQRNLDTLSQEYGENNVTYQDGDWDDSGLRCTQRFAVNAVDGYLLTQGTVEMSATLTMDTSKGLYYSWKEYRDDTGLVAGADLADTTWAVSGNADTTQAALAFRVESFSMESGTLVVSAYSSIHPQGGRTEEREIGSKTVTWTNGTNGVVTFSLTVGDYTWDCCFDAGEAWARLDGSYVGSLSQSTGGEELSTLVEAGAQEVLSALEYDSTSTGNSWSSSDGTVVYNIQVEYPEFDGTFDSDINRVLRKLVQEVVADPSINTDRASLDELQETCESKSKPLPLYDKLSISVQYNRSGYLSLLLTYSQRLTSGQVTYRYDSLNFDLTGEEPVQLSQSDVLSVTGSKLGELINQYTEGEALYSNATAASYLQTWTLSREGIVLYLTQNETTGSCTKVTIPYSNAACTLGE